MLLTGCSEVLEESSIVPQHTHQFMKEFTCARNKVTHMNDNE